MTAAGPHASFRTMKTDLLTQELGPDELPADPVAWCRAFVTSGMSSRAIHEEFSRAFAANSGRRPRSSSPSCSNASCGVLSMGLCEVPMPKATSAIPFPC